MYRQTRIRRILQLLCEGNSERQIARMLHVSRNTIAEISMIFKYLGKPWDEVLEMDDDVLAEIFRPGKFARSPEYALVDYSYVHSELRKTGVTLKLLWQEYCEKCSEEGAHPCSYSTFTRGYDGFVNIRNYTSRIKHRPGETIEVDWAGPVMYYTNPDNGKNTKAYLFVAALAYSQYVYVEATNSMSEKDWLSCHVNLFNYLGGTPIKIVCDNLKTAVTTHPYKGQIDFNEHYLTMAEYYNIAVMPAQIKKPKQKASVEGSVGMITNAVIGRLRNEKFTSLQELNAAILTVLRDFNEAPFQKRTGSRKLIFEAEEKPYLRSLPLVPYEVCEWAYGHKVGSNSHVWFRKCQYSVPYRFIGETVDIKYDTAFIYIYHNRYEIAKHRQFPPGTENAMRTDETHLPIPLKKEQTVESIMEKAADIGENTYEVVKRMFEDAKVKDQPALDAIAIVSITRDYPPNVLERACEKALLDHRIPSYSDIREHLKKKDRIRRKPEEKKPSGIVRGADYYRNGGKDK